MDATAKPLLYLCRRRAFLLRKALEALETPLSGGNWACKALDAVVRELDSIERELERQKSGRNSE